MDESILLLTLCYILFCLCVVYPPEEFHRLGLTIEQLFWRLVGLEEIDFVRYQQRRTTLNLLVHSGLPAVYFLIWPSYVGNDDGRRTMDHRATLMDSIMWKMAKRFSFLAFLAVFTLLLNWWQRNWKRHPISQTLSKFATTPDSYMTVASSISDEFRRGNIYKRRLNSISTLIVTENWIIKTSLYNVQFANQGQASLSVINTETFNISHTNIDELQMVNIEIKSNRPDVSDFTVRINSLNFRTLEEHISRPIHIPSHVQFHRNIIDRFIDVFKEQVAQNAIYTADTIADKCFACMIATPNIKIQRHCTNNDGGGAGGTSSDPSCTNCNCRPMWCVECLARWFAAKQSEYQRDVWLQQKCTCPMCRATFCILDVSYVRTSAES